MSAHSTIRFMSRVAASLVAAVLTVGLVSSPAYAAPPERHRTVAAMASRTDCVGATCTDTHISATTDGESRLCVDAFTFNTADPTQPPTIETGCRTLSAGALTIDARGLSGASLAPTTVTLEGIACGPQGCSPTGETRDVTVSATLTGVGGIATFKGNSKSTFEGCSLHVVGKGTSRQALAVVALDGTSASGPGVLATSSDKIRIDCS